MRYFRKLWLVCLSVAAASRVMAQPPPPAPPLSPPQPEQPAPPQAPPANWAPPPPGDTSPESNPSPAPQPTAPQPQAGSPVAEPGAPIVTGPPTPPYPPTPEQPPSAEPPEQVAPPPAPDELQSELEIYGFAMLDIGYDFGKIGDPLWEDVERPTKLEAFPNEFGRGGRTFVSVRQSRFGVKGTTPTSAGEIKTQFEFELFGVGVDAGQTTFRLRHAFGEWRHIIAGQTWSPFMDPDVFPNSIEYWGPNGMVFYRTVHIEYRPWTQDKSYATISLEKPGGSADQGNFADRDDLQNVVPRFPAPDVTGNVHFAGPWGHVQLAAIFRYLKWDDLAPSPVIQGHAYGWGVNLSTNLKLGPTILKLQGVYGNAIANYMNDATFDVGPKASNNPAQPVQGEAIPLLGIVAFLDIDWNKCLTSTVGWSYVHMWNTAEQTPDAFHVGHYALANLLVHPSKQLFFGAEFQFGRRENNSDGFTVNDYRAQFSIQYKFSQSIGGVK
jgi:hypothetical protein